jgi:hypothetical protein
MHDKGNRYFVYTQEIKDIIAGEIDIPEKDVDISQTTVGFILEDLHSKNIPVIADLDIGYKKQFDQYEPPILSPCLKAPTPARPCLPLPRAL